MKKIATTILLFTSMTAFGQAISLPAPPASGKYEEASTRGVELCMNLNYIMAMDLQSSILEKHKKTPFLSADELLVITDFEPYRINMLNSALLGKFLTEAASDFIDGFVPNEDTLNLVSSYYFNAPKESVQNTVTICNSYVDIIRPKVDSANTITLAIGGQKKLLSEDLFRELTK